MTPFTGPFSAECRQVACGWFLATSAVGLALVMGGCANAPGRPPASNRDYLTGWFQRPEAGTVIPVFQRNGTYYSVCRGVEVPLRPCAEGLEWAITPSSMTGTKIGWDPAARTYYLAVMDQQAFNFTDGRAGGGEKEPLVRIAPPSGLPGAKARRPRALDDLLGWYQPIWFPGIGFEIRKDGDRYVSQEREFHGPMPGSWKTRVEPRELTPLPDQSGFTGFDRKGRHRLVYNETLKRLELVKTIADGNPSVIRMPLAQVAATSSLEKGNAPLPRVRIGIPSWH